ncbi:MAG: hypothetical protein KA712_24060 [Myxococcales bacterium]|nr:hypothetical protein [Myxococcales bacterium]
MPLALLTLLAAATLAAPPAPRPSALALLAAADEATAEALMTTLQALTRDSAFRVVARLEPFADEDVLAPSLAKGFAAVAWFDLRDATTSRLHVLDVANARAVTRSFLAPDSATYRVEQLAQAFRTVLDALEAGGDIGDDADLVRRDLGLPAAQAPPPAPAPVPRSAPVIATSVSAPRLTSGGPPRWDAELAAHYGTAWLGTPFPLQHGFGLGAALLRGEGAWRWGVRASGAYTLPPAVALAPTLDARVDIWSLRVGPALARRFSGWRAELGVDLGADLVRASARLSPGSPYTARDARFGPSFLLRPRLRATWAVFRDLNVFAEAGLGLELSDLALALREDGAQRTVVDAATVRPEFSVGFAL